MSWTEESVTVEFRTHIVYWQEKLRLRDTVFNIEIVGEINGDKTAWCAVKSANLEANPYECDMFVLRGAYARMTRYDVWGTVAHELVHVMNWSMSRAFTDLTDWFSVAEMNLARTLMKRGNEELAYKWESILTGWFAADAPPKEIP